MSPAETATPSCEQLGAGQDGALGAGQDGDPKVSLAPAHTDWLRNRLTVSGPATEVARFRATAQGTSAVAWHLDFEHEEQRLLVPTAGLGAEALALERELRDVIAVRRDRGRACWAEPGSCPLEMHRLIPVPNDMLRLGEDAPAA